MSKEGWARLMKQQQQQQQESTHSISDDNEYQVQKYKNINIATTCSTTPSTPLSTDIRASCKLFQIVRRWKTQSSKPLTPRGPRRSTSSTSSSSCSKLNFVPLSCITFSSIQLYSDQAEDDDDDDDAGNDIHIASPDSCFSKNAKIPASPLLHGQSRSVHQPAQLSTSPQHTMKETQCTVKERESDSTWERKVRGPARRALSCPKLSSQLSLCTSMQADAEEEEDETERLKPKEEEAGRMKLRRSSSTSPLRRQPSTPKGYLALYVGEERRRFLVKANLLNHPLFSILLEKAKEEFGFDQKGPLNIPCDIPFFQHILFLVESNDPSLKNADLSSLLLDPFPSANHLAATVV